MNERDDSTITDLVAIAVERSLIEPGFDLDRYCLALGALAPIVRERVQALKNAGLLSSDASIAGLHSGEAPESTHADRVAPLLDALRAKPDPGSRYELRREIGRGGMGTVYRVRDATLERYLAMKVVGGIGSSAIRTMETPPDQVLRFLREARVLARLDHPGIVPIHDLGVDEQGQLFFTMKLVQSGDSLGDSLESGRTLEAILGRSLAGNGEWGPTRVLTIVLRVCDALAFAHTRGVIHRDVKPSNVMVGQFGEVYLMDWGLALIEGDQVPTPDRVPGPTESLSTDRGSEEGLTRTGQRLGTPEYMAPEQARGHIADRQTDAYSVGAILYRALTGVAPYQDGTTPTERRKCYQVLARLLEGPPQPVANLAPTAPAELIAICDKAMARERLWRYQDVETLARDLRAFIEGRVVHAYETGAWAEAKKWVKRNRALATSLATAILLLVAGLTTSLVLKGRSDENARLASEKAKDVLSLSAIQNLKDLEERADGLWPAYPEMLRDIEKWLDDARVLIEGRPASARLNAQPSLVEHEVILQELRKRAKQRTPEQIERDRRTSPKYAEWKRALAELTWMRRMLDTEAWPSDASVEIELAQETLPEDANGLNHLAWRLVNPDAEVIVYGGEVRARILAQRAVDIAPSDERADIRDTLAWALWRLGRFEAAIAELANAIEDSNGEQRVRLTASLKKMREKVERWQGEFARIQRSEDAILLEARVAELDLVASERQTYEFDNIEDRWWHLQLTKLVSDLKAFQDESSGGLYSAGISKKHGWGIVKRAEFARTINERSVSGPEAQRRWDEAIAAIGNSPTYRGLKIEPQIGVLPIGPDPDSGLWEFVHLQSGTTDHAVPKRDANGKLVLTEDVGIVLVLLPGGPSLIGAQKKHPQAPNYDHRAIANEGPTFAVTIAPFFLAKYELTQAQWKRLCNENRSTWGPDGQWEDKFARVSISPTLMLPVETVAWDDLMLVLDRSGLTLPTEIEWEYAARAGDSVPTFVGASFERLQGKCNIADAWCEQESGMPQWGYTLEVDDGFMVTAPVGSFAPNSFGLHDTIGNVSEWCSNLFHFYPLNELKTLESHSSIDGNRSFRGGSWNLNAVAGRHSSRFWAPSSSQGYDLGARAARPLLGCMNPIE